MRDKLVMSMSCSPCLPMHSRMFGFICELQMMWQTLGFDQIKLISYSEFRVFRGLACSVGLDTAMQLQTWAVHVCYA